MGLFSNDKGNLEKLTTMAELAQTSYDGFNVAPKNWQKLSLKAFLGSGHTAGIKFDGWGALNSDTARKASGYLELLKEAKGPGYVISFRGTDTSLGGSPDLDDMADWPAISTLNGAYIQSFVKLLREIKEVMIEKNISPKNITFTGHSLGAGAVNQLFVQDKALFGGFFSKSKFIGFESPILAKGTNISNFGIETDLIYKLTMPNSTLGTNHVTYLGTKGSGIAYDHRIDVLIDHLKLLGESEIYKYGGGYLYDEINKDSFVYFISDKKQTNISVTDDKESIRNYVLGRDIVDNVTGTKISDIVAAMGGHDTIKGSGGFDQLFGGKGVDIIYSGQTFNDKKDLEKDLIDGGEGNDFLYGGYGGDSIVGRQGDDLIKGGNGHDRLFGDYRENAYFKFTKAQDVSFYEFTWEARYKFAVTLSKSSYDFFYQDGDWIDNKETNYLAVLAGKDKIYGGEGDDDIYGGQADDILYGEDGFDSLAGGTGNDTLYGGDGDDTLNGGPGIDRLDGGNGADNYFDMYGGDTIVETLTRPQGGGYDEFCFTKPDMVVGRGYDHVDYFGYVGVKPSKMTYIANSNSYADIDFGGADGVITVKQDTNVHIAGETDPIQFLFGKGKNQVDFEFTAQQIEAKNFHFDARFIGMNPKQEKLDVSMFNDDFKFKNLEELEDWIEGNIETNQRGEFDVFYIVDNGLVNKTYTFSENTATLGVVDTIVSSVKSNLSISFWEHKTAAGGSHATSEIDYSWFVT